MSVSVSQLTAANDVRTRLTVAGLALLMAPASPSATLGSNAASRERSSCTSYAGLPGGFGTDVHAGMLYIPSGELVPGSPHGYPEERGGSRVYVPGFWLDRTEVTYAQFSAFVRATGYVTSAERSGAAPVFHEPSARDRDRAGDYSWWRLANGASWRDPEARGQAARELANRPVVQVAHADALAYARWLGRTLPSELQWEYAAKAGRDSEALHREPRDARGRPAANFWQGDFPVHNDREDGFESSAPVGCFAPNAFGLFDMLGNVWEWTSSAYTSSHRADDAVGAAADGGRTPACSEPSISAARLVIKGGSFLCSANFCARYRVAARHAQEADQPAMHLGFRTALAATP